VPTFFDLIPFLSALAMTHPLIPQITELATPVAAALGLDVVGAVFHTHQNPPILRIDIRNQAQDTSLTDCQQMSHALEAALDESDLIPDAYTLEISSPGISRTLTSDREFVSFKGFPVEVTTTEPHNGHTAWVGNLVRRDDDRIHLSQKGRAIVIPRVLVDRVQLVESDS
jgi:ribosome maturation factor RimP